MSFLLVTNLVAATEMNYKTLNSLIYFNSMKFTSPRLLINVNQTNGKKSKTLFILTC